MGFFFRKSASFGPFRLNFSKSGIGGSIGVKGARLTMTPRGTTYVTVGSHGFYYRQTVGHRGSSHQSSNADPAPPQSFEVSDSGRIASADSSALVESSSEQFVQRLNRCAGMANPAWLLYTLAALCLLMLTTLADVPSLPNLPDLSTPYSAERTSNTVDDYSAVIARFGEPNSIRLSEVDPLVSIPVATVSYTSAHVDIAFVPNGCPGSYGEILRMIDSHRKHNPLTRPEAKTILPCTQTPDSGWTAIAYSDNTDDGIGLSAAAATSRLAAIPVRRTESPTVATIPEQKVHAGGDEKTKTRAGTRRDIVMKPNVRYRISEEQAERAIRDAENRARFSQIGLFLAAIGFLTGGIVVHKRNSEARKSRLVYDLDSSSQQRFNVVQQSLGLLATCHRIWRIDATSASPDWKRNAGAHSLVRRSSASIATQPPPRVEANVPIPCLDLRDSQLYFLPDIILYRDGHGFGAVAYDDFQVKQSFTRFIEESAIPADAVVVDYTWRYVNKGGGPDRRFNNNRQLPVLQLGELKFTSAKGLYILLNVSNARQSLAFADTWQTLSRRGSSASKSANSQAPPRRPTPDTSPMAAARKVLGVDDTASAAEISAAYKHLAQMYHPDKVAGMAPEFQMLAETRMKEINAAYELLKCGSL